jgi:HSP20 family protein
MNDLTVFTPFAKAFDRGLSSLFEDFDRGFLDMPQSRVLRTNVEEDENEYRLVAEVPGLKEDQLGITYENGVISVEANYGEKKGQSFRTGKFSKAYRVPDVDGDNIKAELKDGILTVTLPKAEKAKAKKITINK